MAVETPNEDNNNQSGNKQVPVQAGNPRFRPGLDPDPNPKVVVRAINPPITPDQVVSQAESPSATTLPDVKLEKIRIPRVQNKSIQGYLKAIEAKMTATEKLMKDVVKLQNLQIVTEKELHERKRELYQNTFEEYLLDKTVGFDDKDDPDCTCINLPKKPGGGSPGGGRRGPGGGSPPPVIPPVMVREEEEKKEQATDDKSGLPVRQKPQPELPQLPKQEEDSANDIKEGPKVRPRQPSLPVPSFNPFDFLKFIPFLSGPGEQVAKNPSDDFFRGLINSTGFLDYDTLSEKFKNDTSIADAAKARESQPLGGMFSPEMILQGMALKSQMDQMEGSALSNTMMTSGLAARMATMMRRGQVLRGQSTKLPSDYFLRGQSSPIFSTNPKVRLDNLFDEGTNVIKPTVPVTGRPIAQPTLPGSSPNQPLLKPGRQRGGDLDVAGPTIDVTVTGTSKTGRPGTGEVTSAPAGAAAPRSYVSAERAHYEAMSIPELEQLVRRERIKQRKALRKETTESQDLQLEVLQQKYGMDDAVIKNASGSMGEMNLYDSGAKQYFRKISNNMNIPKFADGGFMGWFNKGVNTRIPVESKAKFGNPFSYFQKNPDPTTLFGDDALQRGQSNKNFKAGKKPGLFGRPDRAFGLDLIDSFKQKRLVTVPASQGGPMSGPTPVTRELVKRPVRAMRSNIQHPVMLALDFIINDLLLNPRSTAVYDQVTGPNAYYNDPAYKGPMPSQNLENAQNNMMSGSNDQKPEVVPLPPDYIKIPGRKKDKSEVGYDAPGIDIEASPFARRDTAYDPGFGVF